MPSPPLTAGPGVIAEIDAPRARLGALASLGALTVSLLAAWVWRDWALWPAVSAALSGASGVWVAGRSRRDAHWPPAVSTLLGALDAGVWLAMLAWLRTGLEPADHARAVALLLPTLALGPVLAASWLPAAWAYARGQGAALVVGGGLTVALSLGRAHDWPLTPWLIAGAVVLLFGVLPLALSVRGGGGVPRAGIVAGMIALGLGAVSASGMSAGALAWMPRFLNDRALYERLNATLDDLPDPYAIGTTGGRAVLVFPFADLRAGGDYLDILVWRDEAGAPRADLTDRLFLPIPSDAQGRVEEGGRGLSFARFVLLTERGTKAAPLTREPLRFVGQSVRWGTHLRIWSGLAGAGVAGLAVALCVWGWRRRAGPAAATLVVGGAAIVAVGLIGTSWIGLVTIGAAGVVGACAGRWARTRGTELDVGAVMLAAAAALAVLPLDAYRWP